MAWRDRREPEQNFNERWGEAARETEEADRRPRRRTPGPVWDMRRSRSRSVDRLRDDQDSRFNRNDDRDRFNGRDRFDRNNRDNRYDRDNRYNRDSRDDHHNRRSDYNSRYDRYGRSSRDPDRFERDDRRNNDREDRFNRDRDREDDRHDNRYDDKLSEDVPIPPSPPKLTEREKEEMRSVAEVNRENAGEASVPSPGDWYCVCGSLNFKRRSTCYRRGCQYLRSDGSVFEPQNAGEEGKPVGITKRLLFRRLDTLTNEEKILEVLKQRVPQIVDSITGITIGRDSLTGTSRGLAYLNFNSLSDSTTAHTMLIKLTPHLRIDNRDVLITYCHDKPKSATAGSNVPNVDYAAYYLQTGIDYSNGAAMSETDRINAAAAVAQSAISAAQARTMWMPNAAPAFVTNSANLVAVDPPDGKGTVKYSPPDVRTFMYDETSGYYYDASTGLYYDGNTQYFYNNQLNAYLYWDASNATYYLATQSQQNTEQPKLPKPPQATAHNTIVKAAVIADTESNTPAPVEDKKRQKEDKVKVAKKIAKDMARWAKSLNQKKENAKFNIVSEQTYDHSASKGSADIGFSVLGASGPALPPIVREISPIPQTEAEFLIKNVEEVPPAESDEGIIDWSKLTCLLCKRRFPAADVLTKHKNMSDLHKQNLVEYCKNKAAESTANGYRDRAAERRMKYGETEEPARKSYKPQVVVMPPPVPSASSVLDTVGGKMLQKMGWSEGKGLGRDGQGRTAPIEAEKRVQGAGLGQKRGIYTAAPGETYRETVKKLAIARYNDLLGDES